MPTPTYPPQFWQQYLQNALNALHQNPNDMEAHQAIGLAESHLAGTDSGGPAFTGQSIMHGLGLSGPQTAGDTPVTPLGPFGPRAGDLVPGGDMANVAQGVESAVSGIPKGLAQIAHQLGHGDVLGAGKGVVQGIGQTASGALAPIELALRELTGENVPQAERASMLNKGGQGLTGLATMEAGGRALGALKKGLGGPASPKAPTPTPDTPSGPPAGFEPTSAGPQSPPGTAAPVEPNPVNLPRTTPPPTGFDPYSSGTSSTGLESSLLKLAAGLQPGKFPGLMGNEAGDATGAAAQSGASGATPMGGTASRFTNPEPIAPQGISVEGPPTPEVPPGGYPPTVAEMARGVRSPSMATDASRVAGQKGVTFGNQSSLPAEAQGTVKDLLGQISRAGRSGEAGFTTPQMLELIIGLPISSAILKRMGVTGAQVLTNPGLQSTFMNMAKSGGGALMGGATQAPDTTGVQ